MINSMVVALLIIDSFLFIMFFLVVIFIYYSIDNIACQLNHLNEILEKMNKILKESDKKNE